MKKILIYSGRGAEKLLIGIIIVISCIDMVYMWLKRPIIYLRHGAKSFARAKINNKISFQKTYLKTLSKQLCSIGESLNRAFFYPPTYPIYSMNFPNLPEIENFYFDDHDIKTRFLNEVFTGENNKIPFLKKFKNMMHTHFSYSGSWVNGAGDPLNDIALTQPPHIQEELFDLISEYDPEDPISATNANLTYVLQDKVEPELKDFGLELIQKHKIKDWGDNTFATRPTISISDVHLFSTFLKQIRYLDADLTQWIGLIFEATTEHYKDILHNKGLTEQLSDFFIDLGERHDEFMRLDLGNNQDYTPLQNYLEAFGCGVLEEFVALEKLKYNPGAYFEGYESTESPGAIYDITSCATVQIDTLDKDIFLRSLEELGETINIIENIKDAYFLEYNKRQLFNIIEDIIEVLAQVTHIAQEDKNSISKTLIDYASTIDCLSSSPPDQES